MDRGTWGATVHGVAELDMTEATDASLEGLMLKLKLQYFGYLMQRVDSLEKTLMLGETEGRRRGTEGDIIGWHHQLKGHEFEQTLGDSEGWGAWHAAVHRVPELDTT